MNNTPGKRAVLTSLKAVDPATWSILGELSQTPEESRRPILRPHVDAAFGAADGLLTAKRLELDGALAVLTDIEIACQVGTLTIEEALETLPTGTDEHLKALFGSQAFLRYCNAYLYFAIRFLAGRIAAPPWLAPDCDIHLPRPVTSAADSETNLRPFALVSPPPIVASQQTDSFLATLVELTPTTEIGAALMFLDDFVEERVEEEKGDNWREADHFELWLRGLRSDVTGRTAFRFNQIRDGLSLWAVRKAQFYLDLESRPWGADLRGWVACNPAVPRLALADMYWIARVLRADVTANAKVTYSGVSWLSLLVTRATLDVKPTADLRAAEEVLRSVFDFVCDLVQNADEVTDSRERRAFDPDACPELPEHTARWRQTFDEELAEIQRHRQRRQYQDSANPAIPAPPGARAEPATTGDGWTERIKTGRQPHNLFGLSFSGGGIRSATFNLGVLQALQERDLLYEIDYLSTVSGGGFIGSWLVGNVSRTTHWLGRLTSWDESIAHLRRYSNYLAPRTGVLAPDTWTMWASWARNAFLVQLSALTWLAVILLAFIAGERPFVVFGARTWAPYVTLILATPALAVLIYSFLDRKPLASKWIQRGAVLPVYLSSFALASVLWSEGIARAKNAALVPTTYSGLLLSAWTEWSLSLIFYGVALVVIAAVTLSRRKGHALWIGVAAVGALYLQFCAILKLFVFWAADPERFVWYAYVFGPPLVLLATTVSLVLFIGFCGRNSTEPIREWWTRIGASLGAYAVVTFGLAGAAVFGPKLVALLAAAGNKWINWAALATWVGTIISGLVAGQSSKTSGTGKDSSRGLQILARVAGVLFILGGILAVAVTVYIGLMLAGTDYSLRQSFDQYWATLGAIHGWTARYALIGTFLAGLLFSWCFEINIFGLNQFYRNRLVRCYLGATRWIPGLRRPVPFTQFDPNDDMKLSALTGNFRGPFPIFNCALNLAGSRDLALHTRHSASFSLTPLRCGSARALVGYAPTVHEKKAFAGGVMLGQAVAISGAAASPNMGYNTSPLVAFLLTMFNVRLGWWFPNPGREAWDRSGLRFSLYYMVKELLGSADENRYFVNVSDGGHFENLGVYELVRRRCKVIVACDAECDEDLTFGSLGNLVRLCETDFGAKIDIDVTSIRRPSADANSSAHCAVGKITYSNGSIGYLIYIKASLTGDEPIGVAQYHSGHRTFPHESTGDQFFAEPQFESYRQLGYHITQHTFRGSDTSQHPVAIAERLYDVWAPAGFANELFIKHTTALDGIWERMRLSPALHRLMRELSGAPSTEPDPELNTDELSLGLELIQLIENAYLDLRLDDFWDHPDNRGWVVLLSTYARSARFRKIWRKTHSVFGIRFEYFCESRLGLRGDRPVVRR